jgi:hypothetical protein
MLQTPSTDEVRQIAAMQNAIVRNLRITLAYHELALAVAARSGGAANWCTFATWASRQAGQTIRGEDLFAVLRERLHVPMRITTPLQSLWRGLLKRGLLDPKTRLGRFVRAVQGPLDPLERASDAVGRGNRKVFEEIGHEFARFMATCGRDAAPDPASVDEFCRTLRDGDPPEGQRFLRQAFRRYYHAFFEARADVRAQSLYLANLEIGWHEQTRLQAEIQEALDSPALEIRELGEHVLMILSPAARNWYRVFYVPASMTLGVIVLPLASVARRLAREVITECLMMLFVPPDRALRLGRDLSIAFPESLRQLSGEEVLAALAQLRCDVHQAHACGAEDWADLRERLHFIAHLFRACSEDAALASPPFDEAQIARIRASQLPPGRL